MAELIFESAVPGRNVVSFKKRYLFKLMTNVLGLGIGLISQSIIPRALGPASYGNFSFLTNFFQQVIGFLNLNSSSAFYTKLSQRQNDHGLVVFYFRFVLILGVLVGLFLVLSYGIGKNQTIWPGQAWPFVVMGAVWAFLTFVVTTISEMADAYGLTVKAETTKLFLKLLGLFIIVGMFWQKFFSLRNFFIYHFFILTVSIFFLTRIVRDGGRRVFSDFSLPREQSKLYAKEFLLFCSPLVVFLAVAILEGLLERWFLQRFSGSIQQGFYGLAYQIGAVCFLFTSAMIPLLVREYAISFAKQDIDEMKRLFSRFAPMLYAIAAYFSCFLAIEARNVTQIFGGHAYAGAAIPIAIMCFFPIHQTYGQINSSIYFATARTKTYRNIGIASSCISLPLAFFLVGPKQYGALELGATGLAVKMVLVNVVGVNIQFWYNAKFMKLSFLKNIIHQVMVVFVFVVIALAGSKISHSALKDVHFIGQVLLSGVLYTAGIAGVALFLPYVCGLAKGDISRLVATMKQKVFPQT